jgi:hypothetical protein
LEKKTLIKKPKEVEEVLAERVSGKIMSKEYKEYLIKWKENFKGCIVGF